MGLRKHCNNQNRQTIITFHFIHSSILVVQQIEIERNWAHQGYHASFVRLHHLAQKHPVKRFSCIYETRQVFLIGLKVINVICKHWIYVGCKQWLILNCLNKLIPNYVCFIFKTNHNSKFKTLPVPLSKCTGIFFLCSWT